MEIQEKLFARLDELGIAYRNYSHAPAFTCEQMAEHRDAIPEQFGEVKNLFLKDKKKRYYLLSALYDTKISLKDLAKDLEAPELRFARPDELEALLGVKPGSVTPFGLINDTAHVVSVLLDQALVACDVIGIHPLRNDMTTVLAVADFMRFLEAHDYAYKVIPFASGA